METMDGVLQYTPSYLWKKKNWFRVFVIGDFEESLIEIVTVIEGGCNGTIECRTLFVVPIITSLFR